MLYTLLESAKLVGVEPRDYLRAAAENALTAKPALLPHGYPNSYAPHADSA